MKSSWRRLGACQQTDSSSIQLNMEQFNVHESAGGGSGVGDPCLSSCSTAGPEPGCRGFSITVDRPRGCGPERHRDHRFAVAPPARIRVGEHTPGQDRGSFVGLVLRHRDANYANRPKGNLNSRAVSSGRAERVGEHRYWMGSHLDTETAKFAAPWHLTRNVRPDL